MIRKANVICLALLPLMVLTLVLTNLKIGQATSYSGPCPNVIGTMYQCPEGWTPSYAPASPHGTCHTGTYTGWDPQNSRWVSVQLCCQYSSRYVVCTDSNGFQDATLYGPVEYFRSTASMPCSSGYCPGFGPENIA